MPVRKLGKLPAKTIEVEYELEYGRSALAIHEDAINVGQRVLIVDDVLATGGTAEAAGKQFARQIATASKAGVWLQREDGGWYKK